MSDTERIEHSVDKPQTKERKKVGAGEIIVAGAVLAGILYMILPIILHLIGLIIIRTESDRLQALSKEQRLAKEEYRQRYFAICEKAMDTCFNHPNLVSHVAIMVSDDAPRALKYLDRSSYWGKASLPKSIMAPIYYHIPDQREKAEKIFAELEAQPDKWEAQYGLATAYLSCKLYDRALAAANRWVALIPKSAAAVQARARAYEGLGDKEKADKDFALSEELSKKYH